MQEKDIKHINGHALPEELLQLHKSPDKLYLRGNQELLHRHPRVGIVGARKLTPYGREVTTLITSVLARHKVVVVSGLALGIDSIAHRSCLEAQGQTIAVLPSGIEAIYPANHAGLAQQIVKQNGLLVSEYPDKSAPMKHQFIERNRIIAALSDVLIITEAAERSGSLHTARFGLELGKTIMAVPGTITNPYSAGANRLIQSGAMPILSPQDVLDVLGIQPEDKLAYLPENEAEASILENLQAGGIQTEELLRTSGLDITVFQTHITMLEIKGVINASAGYWSIK